MKERVWLGRALLVLAFVALILLGVILGTHLRGRRTRHRPRLLVAFLDVGTGDCTLILSPDGHAALIDAGPAVAGPTIAETLRHQGVRSLDLLVLASPAADSIGGIPSLLAGGVSVAKVWDNPARDTGEMRRAAQAALLGRHIPFQTAHQGVQTYLGTRGVRLTVLWPPGDGARAHTDALACRLDYGTTRMVLAGPVNGVEEGFLVASAREALACDVLQLAAGGSDSATSAEMLRRAAPSVAVISSAANAPPGPAALHRLQAAGAEVWRTDTQGAITVFSDGRGPPVVTAAHM